MITAGQLQGMPVRTKSCRRLGRVAEIHVRDGAVAALVCGPSGWLQRFLPGRGGPNVAWDRVERIDAREIVVREERSAGR